MVKQKRKYVTESYSGQRIVSIVRQRSKSGTRYASVRAGGLGTGEVLFRVAYAYIPNLHVDGSGRAVDDCKEFIRENNLHLSTIQV